MAPQPPVPQPQVPQPPKELTPEQLEQMAWEEAEFKRMERFKLNLTRVTVVKRERKAVVLRLRHFREVIRKNINHVIFPDGKQVLITNLLN